ncbi:hypothetical protein QTI33_08600 [Variovorax sp. J22P271]|uniref:hypothetical protein n=1 Tax=Variovorax davisae TaxID=3053515 RepID=UPI0025785083|nr:hypothetical protein [Variovorax sp. J22P271]MDM0032192.1 hypothetical protein [Variovorax sp. J22P271]
MDSAAFVHDENNILIDTGAGDSMGPAMGDADQEQARTTRLRLLQRSNIPGQFIAGAHLELPALDM